MWEKIKAFFKNKVVITIEFIIIGICCAGLIIAGITVEEIAKIPTLVAGILGAISAFILYIIGMTRK